MEKNQRVWIDIKSDLVAGVTSFSQCMALGDVLNDGDNKLICGDINSKLKVFKQECLVSESKLQYCPVSVITYNTYEKTLKTIMQYLAVAGGSYIYIYKNMKGAFKLVVPNVEVSSLEIQIWEDLKMGKLESNQAIEKLKDMVNQKISLSPRSLELLSFKDEFAIKNYILENQMEPLVVSNYITCMSSIKKINPDDEESISQLVVGTEGKNIFLIDGSECKIINKYKINGIPSAISCHGSYDSEYRIYIACRNEIIYTLKNGEVLKSIYQVSSKIINLVRLEKGLYVSCMNSYYHCYSATGKKVFSIKQPSEIYSMEICNMMKSRKMKGVMLGLKNSEVRFYNDKQLLTAVSIPETIFGIRFGKLGKNEDTLIVVSDKGSIYVKQLEKSVNFDGSTYKKVGGGGEESTLNIPKKTTMFLDLMEREKEYYKGMYSTFQSDLNKLRFKTLDTYAKLIIKGHAPQNYSTVSNIKLNVSLQGLGPNFRLLITVDNSGEDVINSVDLIVEYDKKIYDFPKENIQLGLIMPHIPTKYSLKFRNISDSGVSGIVKIMIVEKTNTAPLIVNKIKVPISELELI